MPTFILTLNWTDQGIRAVKDAPKRSQAAKELAKKVGVEIKQVYPEINFAVESLICTGVLRSNTADRHCFYDVLTALPLDDEYEARQPARVRQGIAICHAAVAYKNADTNDPRGYSDKIEVIPFHDTDYVSRELARMESEDE